MKHLQSSLCFVAFIAIGFSNAAYSQVRSINSVVITPHVFNDVPSAIFTGVTNYPSLVSLSEQNVSKASGFADRDVWQFSNNGTNAYQFQNDDFFHVSFELTLTGSPITPRKEAGFLFSTASSGDIQSIVNTDGHEVVQFGGIGFYSFNVQHGITYTSGNKITLGIDYFLDANGKHALVFSANGVRSPVQEFTTGGIGTGTLGGYFQIVNDPTNSTNSGTAVFENISLSTTLPFFTSVADKGLGAGLSWAGGTGPFLLQTKTSLSDPDWFNALTTDGGSLILPKVARTGFWRLGNATTNTILPFTVLMNGASEVPVITNTTATAAGLISIEGTNLAYQIDFSGLSAPATMAHIHGYTTPTNSAGVLIPLHGASGTSGTLSGTTNLTLEELAGILNGTTYVNIHTTNHPGGEIRGQIVPLNIPIVLNGASEVPVVTTSAIGTGSLNLIGSELYYTINYSGLSGPGTLAHIHGPATATNSASPIVPLINPTGTTGTISGTVPLNPTNLLYLLAGLTYINIHSTTNLGGEIRGQIYPLQFKATMNGASEVPATASSGVGRGTINLVDGFLSCDISFSNLLSAAKMAHIHGPADTAHNAGVLIPFTSVPAAESGIIAGSTNLDMQNLYYLISGLTYANIHTTNYPGGEIRGQIVPNN